VVAAASYEARGFGVRSAMPGVTARRRCPQLLFVKPRFDVYRRVSRQIHEIFQRYSDTIEPLSLDEAYLDVTRDIAGIGSATAIAERIRSDIRRELQLTASAGVSYNKFIAKLASDQNKPDGICVIRPEAGARFVAGLPARRFHGVGPRTAERMAGLGIHTGADLRAQSLSFLELHFGSSARYLYQACRGIDDRPVRPDRERKSIGAERTYAEDLFNEQDLMGALSQVGETVWERIADHGRFGRTLTLKIKFADFRQITRSRTVASPIAHREALAAIARELLQRELPVPRGVRLLGLTLSGLAATGTTVPDTASPCGVHEPMQPYLDF
jgi:DNA polymerase-4